MAQEFPPKLRAIIIAHLRRIGYRNTTYKQNMAAAHRGFGEWECAGCKQLFKRENLHGDHVLACIEPEKGFIDWNTYMERLFLGEIQPLCKDKCHKEKTAKENIIRRKVKLNK